MGHGGRFTVHRTPVKIVPVNDVSSVCRVCVGLCPGAADSPCKCEKIVNVKHNLLGQVKKKLCLASPPARRFLFQGRFLFYFF